ncbi:MAG TPA: DUF2231 domain-containing protein [Marmoricola sp.]|nr:DUF2231 domain-containing protein [Marmoricola sp.]
MFDLVNGLPVHPLVVHAIVVLLPLGIVGTIAMAVRPGWRHHYGWLVVAVTAAATVLVPIATSSGEDLEKRVGDPGEHAELGDQLIWFALPLLLLSAALMYVDRRAVRLAAVADPADEKGATLASGSRMLTVLAVLAVLAGVAAGVQVYRVGDSGARAAWGEQVSSGR